MQRTSRWCKITFAIILSISVSGSVWGSPAVGQAMSEEITTRSFQQSMQSQERWRYTYEGAGSYELIGWSPTEVAIFAYAPGGDASHMAAIGLSLLDGSELWHVSTEEMMGAPAGGIVIEGDLVVLTTPQGVFGFDLTTGQLRWNILHGFDWAPDIISGDTNNIVFAYGNRLIGIDPATGVQGWEQILPSTSVLDWHDIPDGPLIGLAQPDIAGQRVLVFGIDRTSGAFLWQTPVAPTVSSTGGMSNMTGNDMGVMAITISTDVGTTLSVLDGFDGTLRWSTPIATDAFFARVFLTDGPQPVVVYTEGTSLEVKSATGFDADTGALRWQNENVGTDAILADDVHLIGAGPTLSYMNALVLVDGETGEMRWAQPYALVDGSFPLEAMSNTEQIIFAQANPQTTIPMVLAVDIATGNINWVREFPEFESVSFEGTAAGLDLVTGRIGAAGTLIAF